MSDEKAGPVAVPDASKPGPRLLTPDEIFAADDIEVAVVDVPEWGGSVALRAMSGEEAVAFVKAIQDDKNSKKANTTSQAIRVVGLCAVDADNKPLFTEEQLLRLQKKSLRALMRLQNKAMEINGLSPDETEKLKKD